MSKKLIFVSGIPCSGRTKWITRNYLSEPSTVCVDANDYKSLYTNSKLSDKSIEESRQWCLEQVKKNMSDEVPIRQILLCLISCRPDRWREFIQLAIDYDYEINFVFPSNKWLYEITRHNTTLEQVKYVESKCKIRFPKDIREIRSNSKDEESAYVEINECTLFRNVITEFESAFAFFCSERMRLGTNKNDWLDKINQHYKETIHNEIKRIKRRDEKEAQDAERIKRRIEKEAREQTQVNKEEKEEELEQQEQNQE